MFYHFFVPLSDKIPVLNVFRYLTFRTGGAVMTALLICFIIGPALIRWLKVRQGKGQPIRSDGPQRHVVEKQGTPTMGGLLILVSMVLSTLLWADLSDMYVWMVLLVTLSFGLLGFADDYLKVSKRSSDGVSGRFKLAFQFMIAGVAVAIVMRLQMPPLTGAVTVPFFKGILLQLGWGFIAFGAVVVVGASNPANLTDGVDGLAIVPVMIAAGTFFLISLLLGQVGVSPFLSIYFVFCTGGGTNLLRRAIRGRVGL